MGLLPVARGQSTYINFILVTEKSNPVATSFSDGFKALQDSDSRVRIDQDVIDFSRNMSQDAFTRMCEVLDSGKAISAVVDTTWGGWIKGRKKALEMGLPYVRLQAANLHPFVQAADDFLKSMNAIDAALIFQDKTDLDQGLSYIIGNSFLRIVATQMQDPNILDRLKKMRPRPSNFVVWGDSASINDIYTKAKAKQMITRDTKWTLVVKDLTGSNVNVKDLIQPANVIVVDGYACCNILDRKTGKKFDLISL